MIPAPRGACPSVSAPMPTGDGLLVRLNPRDGVLSPRQLAGVAQAADRFGNGLLEITARGSFQIRGLSPASAPRFAEAVAALGIEAQEGVEVRTGALAGLDAREIADPRPLAAALRAGIREGGLNGRLAAKVSLTVDGGGALPLHGLLADVRLEAGDEAVWRVSAGSIPLGGGSAGEASACALDVLEFLAQCGPNARAKDLSAADLAGMAVRLPLPSAPPARARAPVPVGAFPLRDGSLACGFAPVFGQVEAGSLVRFCAALDEGAQLRPAPGRGLLVVGGGPAERIAAAAERAGFVAQADDVRLKIAACAGAPRCGAAWFDTKRVAEEISVRNAGMLRALPALHLSGCSKGCAKPAGPAVSLVGSETGAELLCEGAACDPRLAKSLKALAESAARGPKVPA